MKQGTEKRPAAERARAARRAAQLRREAEERVAASEPPASTEPEPTTSTPKRRKDKGYTFTAEDIVGLRQAGLSWRQIGVNLDLGSPSAARTAYTALTGRHHSEAEGEVRRAKAVGMGTVKASTRKVYSPEWNDESDQDEIIERLQGARISVMRNVKGLVMHEEILVGKVKRLTWDGPDEALCVHFIDRDSGGTRSVLVKNIKEVR